MYGDHMDKNRYENLLRSLDKDHMFGFGQQRILQSYIKDIQKELSDFTVLYEGNEIHLDSKKFANFKIKVKFDKELNEDSIEGGIYYHRKREILLNPKLLEKPSKLAATIAHETTHALEEYYMTNNHQADSDYIKMLSIYIEGNPVPINCLNFKNMGNGSLHYEPQEKARAEYDYVHDLSLMFYAIHTAEKEAYRVGEQEMKDFCDHYNRTHDDKIMLSANYNISTTVFKKFNERYNLNGYHNDEIESLYNQCFMKIYLQQQPENEVEANIMYDMACLSLYNYRVQQNPQTEAYEHEKANDLIDESVKKQNLRQFGFDYVYSSDYVHHLTFDTSAYIRTIGNEESFLSKDIFFKKDNMKVFLMIAPEIGERITEYIPDMDLLKQMCINDRESIINSGSDLLENGVKIIFGEEFWNQLNEAPAEDVKEYESNEDQNLIVNNYLEAEYDEQNMDL